MCTQDGEGDVVCFIAVHVEVTWHMDVSAIVYKNSSVTESHGHVVQIPRDVENLETR